MKQLPYSFKIRNLTPHKSTLIQQYLFKRKYKWIADYIPQLKNINSKHLYIDGTHISHMEGIDQEDLEFWDTQHTQELTFTQIMNYDKPSPIEQLQQKHTGTKK